MEVDISNKELALAELRRVCLLHDSERALHIVSYSGAMSCNKEYWLLLYTWIGDLDVTVRAADANLIHSRMLKNWNDKSALEFYVPDWYRGPSDIDVYRALYLDQSLFDGPGTEILANV